jgi:uncharacterized FlaG/YvyC family protein
MLSRNGVFDVSDGDDKGAPLPACSKHTLTAMCAKSPNSTRTEQEQNKNKTRMMRLQEINSCVAKFVDAKKKNLQERLQERLQEIVVCILF